MSAPTVAAPSTAAPATAAVPTAKPADEKKPKAPKPLVSLSRAELAAQPSTAVANKVVFVRVDFNVPQRKADASIADDTRIRESLPTIRLLCNAGARVVLASHLGRPVPTPSGGVDETLRMKPIGARLQELLNAPSSPSSTSASTTTPVTPSSSNALTGTDAKSAVTPAGADAKATSTPASSSSSTSPPAAAAAAISVTCVDDCIGPKVVAAVRDLKPGAVLLLENVRFHADEEKNTPAFSQALATDTGAQVYVNDAFGAAHRAHSSTAGIRAFVPGPAYAGVLMAKELKLLGAIRDAHPSPFVALLGGAKLDKLPLLDALLQRVQVLVIGGGLCFPFLVAQGCAVGSSKFDPSSVAVAKTVIAQCAAAGVKLVLPCDLVIANAFKADAERKVVTVADVVPNGWMALDIGPATLAALDTLLATAKTVFWNGPMGVFEFAPFATGTKTLIELIAGLHGTGVTTVVAGGDSAAAVYALTPTLAPALSHISTGGGAALELVQGAAMPGVAVLDPPTDTTAGSAAAAKP